jgi:lipocalin
VAFTKATIGFSKNDPAYRTALVGTPDRKYLGVLSREPHPAEETKT